MLHTPTKQRRRGGSGLARFTLALFYEFETQACASGLDTFRVWLPHSHRPGNTGTSKADTVQHSGCRIMEWGHFISHISHKLWANPPPPDHIKYFRRGNKRKYQFSSFQWSSLHFNSSVFPSHPICACLESINNFLWQEEPLSSIELGSCASQSCFHGSVCPCALTGWVLWCTETHYTAAV